MFIDRVESQPSMRSVVHDQYGPASKLRIKSIPRPICGPDEVLVAVRCVSVNPYDWHNMTGTPLPVRMSGGLRSPKENRLGVDVSGVVESIGSNVRRFKVGDEVFGFADGCFAEFVCALESEVMSKPESVSFKDAAAVPVAALTAIHGLVTNANLGAGEHVLINGASGGVGTFAVQVAKDLGAKVTAVCGPRNGAMVTDLGADQVINYSKEDFTQNRDTYDVILDNVGNRRIRDYKRCLKSNGRYIVVSGPKGKILGPIGHMLKAMIGFKFGAQKAMVFMAQRTPKELGMIVDMLGTSRIKPVIERAFQFDEIAAALDHIETGRTRGKLVVTIAE